MIIIDIWRVSEELNKLEVHVIGGIAYVAVDDVMEILRRNTEGKDEGEHKVSDREVHL